MSADPQKSDRAAETAGRTTQGDQSMRSPTIPQPIPTADLDESLETIERLRLEYGATPCDLIASEVEDAREDLMAAMSKADRYGVSDIRARLAKLVYDVDDIRAILTERRS